MIRINNSIQPGTPKRVSATGAVVTAGSYSSGTVIGGLQTLTNAFRSGAGGLLQSLSIELSSTQSLPLDVHLFNAAPSGSSTVADNGAYLLAAADASKRIGTFTLTLSSNQSGAGVKSIYQASQLAHPVESAGTDLYAVIVNNSGLAITLASTSDLLALKVGILQS